MLEKNQNLKKLEKLSDESRNLLINKTIEYALERSIKLSTTNIEGLSEEIVKKFPGEDKVLRTYFKYMQQSILPNIYF